MSASTLADTPTRQLRQKRLAWDKDIDRVSHCPPDSPEWTSIFVHMDLYYLFHASLRDAYVCAAVAEYVSHHGPHTETETHYSVYPDAFNTLPPELRDEILEWLPLIDRISFGCTSKANKSIASRIFRRCIMDLLRPYGLSYNLVRFLQIITKISISGSAVAWLATYIRNAGQTWAPNDLDFYVPSSMWPFVLRFVVRATQYRDVRTSSSAYAGIPAIRRIAWLTTHVDSALTLNFMQSRTENVRIPATQFHSTCVVGSITADSAWFTNLGLTSRGISIMNRNFFRMSTNAEKRRALAVIRK
ncbi:hypothetical protein K438DRAFT_2127530 [Mycena galopus ATCC 62051]|nr:hypothetical protein K438DRAFT_2127530 [Mycena galopus ATCC 62051]